MARRAKANMDDGVMCCGHGHSKVWVGTIMMVIGLAIKYDYGFADILILVGAMFFIKGLLLKSSLRG